MSAVSKKALQDLLCQHLEVQRHRGPHKTTKAATCSWILLVCLAAWMLMTGWVLLQFMKAIDTSVSGIPAFPSTLWISLWPRATWILFWTAERCRMLLGQGGLVSSLMNFVLLRNVLFLSQCMHIPSAQVTPHPQEAHPVTTHTKPSLDTHQWLITKVQPVFHNH